MTQSSALNTSTLRVGERETGVRVLRAESFWTRARGLLGRRLGHDEALWIRPCNSVHTFGMTYPIDVLFIDSEHRVVRIANDLRSMRIAVARGAHSVVELVAGAAARLGIREGMDVRIVE